MINELRQAQEEHQNERLSAAAAANDNDSEL